MARRPAAGYAGVNQTDDEPPDRNRQAKRARSMREEGLKECVETSNNKLFLNQRILTGQQPEVDDIKSCPFTYPDFN
jgi:hypothetical protein